MNEKLKEYKVTEEDLQKAEKSIDEIETRDLSPFAGTVANIGRETLGRCKAYNTVIDILLNSESYIDSGTMDELSFQIKLVKSDLLRLISQDINPTSH
ncbi:MAG: hypothetical protein PHS49_03575 [Candidatus Gracilibacteria bacterium]|nr:hypothetical protein [Candidatus Gracilibacteria bacterium]